MDFSNGMKTHGFTFTSNEDLPEIEGTAHVGVHKRSGARVLCLQNDDNNKAFAIGFRTPPKDDTGVFHILEHSVLCGSDRFPVKEPFVDLIKSSMQTFLNAMTFADKTLYPVASTNEQDLFNLMDVYLDAVFHPQIYCKRAIFEQEGWHYELRANDEDLGNPADLDASQTTLAYNGVVYSEMKGVLSSADSVLYDELQKALLPDTCYAFESGGTPAAIPTLTYEGFLDEHARHYRTDNSYIILYGNIDYERALAFLDERYLTPVALEQETRDKERAEQGLEPLRPKVIESQAPLRAGYTSKTMDTTPENACAAAGYVIGNSCDRLRITATEILLDALFGSNEAPLTRALLDRGIAHDIDAAVSDALLQPFAVIDVKMPQGDCGHELLSIVEEEMRKLLESGLDHNLIEAAISHTEFVLREHDTSTADGVVYAMVSLSSWLYDDDAPLDYIRYEQMFADLRKLLGEGYFEQLCLELFCENDHTALVEIVPTPGESDDDTPERLERMNNELSAEERARIIAEEAALREHQEKPDAPEDTAKLPRLSVDDIDEAPAEPPYELDANAPISCLRHSVPTRGIVYAYRYFDMSRLAFEDLPYVSILAMVLGKLGTARHTAAELDTLVQGKLGNLTFYTNTFEDPADPLKADPRFIVSASALSENVEELSEIPREVMLETDYSDTSRILDILKQRKIKLEMVFVSNGNACAVSRVKSYYSASGMIGEQLGNVGFYGFLCDLIEHFDERSEALATKLEAISSKLFCDNLCTLSFAGSDEDYDRFWLSKPGLDRTSDEDVRMAIPKPHILNEAFIVPSNVCFAGVGWDRRLLDGSLPYTGHWPVVSRALSYDYLWNEVRVKGGAYGVGFSTTRSGTMRFHSYRDPHLDETIERFAQVPEWISEFAPEKEALEGFIVATVASLDAPMKPRKLIRRQVIDYFMKWKPEDRIEIRKQVIETTEQDIRDLAPAIKSMLDSQARCVFGNRKIIEESKLDWKTVKLLGD